MAASEFPVDVKVELNDSYPDTSDSSQQGAESIQQELALPDHCIDNDELMPSAPILPIEIPPFPSCAALNHSPILNQIQAMTGISHEEAWVAFHRAAAAGRSLFL